LTWNHQSGNLTSRNDAIKSKTENFTYDNLDRLLTSTVTGLTALTMTYAANGNINSKSDVGSYTYSPVKINAVTQISNNPTTIPLLTQNITYTPYFQPSTVTEGAFTQNYTYGHNQQRIKVS
jgi:YD repeat-containing protein